MENESPIDPALSAVADIMLSLTSFSASMEAENLLAMRVEGVKISTPVELDVYHAADGRLVLGSGPPVYTVPTTDMPVLHRLTLTIESAHGKS